jgi:hypothetical protein
VTRILVLALLLGCSRGAPPAPDARPAMSSNERDRGMTLCARYSERVCACAQADPSLADTCALSKGQPEAVRMHLDVLEGAPLAQLSATGEVVNDAGPAGRRPPLNDGERRLTEASLRQIVAACVKLDAELDPAKCPRK